MNFRSILVAVGASLCLAGQAVAQVHDYCSDRRFEDSPFTVCVADPHKDSIEIDWLGPDNKPMRSLRALRDSDVKLGLNLQGVHFAMNAGMFDTGGAPIGLMVDIGETLHALNTGNGEGNFYMKPNGVFAVEMDGSITIRTTEAFRASGSKHYLATQSGPMLVINGELNSAIANDGPSRFIRNAVGRDASGQAVFVISDAPVSFGKLARFLRDGLGCRDALYLDGAVSSLWDPATGRMDHPAPIGPILVVRDED